MKNFLFLGAIATLVNPRLLFCASTSTTSSVDPSVDKKTQRKNRRRVRRRRTRTFHELIKNSPMNDLIDNDSNETVAPKGSDNAGRIIGGTPTDRTLGKYNYVAQFSRGPACGGMLIAPNIILTAAHCKGGFKSAYLGFYDYNSPYGREEILIKDEIIHPDFNKDTFYGQFNYVAQFSRGSACGGMLIAPNIILTAAHCESGGFRNAYLGIYDYNSLFGREKIKVIKEIIHPEYNPVTKEKDFMIVVLQSNSQYEPVCITNKNFLFQKDWLVALGFGVRSPGGSLADKMHKVSLQYISNRKCIEKYSKHKIRIRSNMLCADSSVKGRDACQGDSGGPIVKRTGSGDIAVGVVSWGIGCAKWERRNSD
eukprot:CAMPEP_0194346558 /NCGR_PEP_ID=MMETSP0171-20130528/105494_1 /TAXON_ID=218684 /ORGANISM="Corethron pennatum, Strain L29A3" /LENGTH=366 /DNA_ID=CAMNT_0039113701 /DNA_START=380 /DNA_END=1480 /DNA_ORIENTATION=-